MQPTYRNSCAGNLLLWSDLTLDPSFKVKLLWPNLKVPISRLLLVLEVWDVKTTYRKTCAGNLLMWSDLTLGPSFKVKRRCLNLKVPISRLLLVLLLVKRGWPSLKVPISSLLLLPDVWDVKVTLNSTFLLPGGRSYHCSGLVVYMHSSLQRFWPPLVFLLFPFCSTM